MSDNSIVLKTQDEFAQDFATTVSGEMSVDVNLSPGSVVMATGNASATNNMFLQALNQQLYLDSRITTAQDAALDNLVNQFLPVNKQRIQAVAATSAPVAPTALLAPATSAFLWLGSTAKLYGGQTLSLTRSGKQATVATTRVAPTTTLTANVTNGGTALVVTSTVGMFPGATLTLVDGNYSVNVVLVSITDGTHAVIQALTSTLTHIFDYLTATVTLNGVVGVTGYVYATGTVLGDLTVGTTATATSLLEGQYFYRLAPDATTPSIAANDGTQAGYRVQTQIGSIAYEVTADVTNPNYSTTAKAYVIPANVSGVYVKVTAVNAGTGSNMQANQLVLMPTPLNGIDGTNNPVAIQNGADLETNDALRLRFQEFILSQNSANKTAIAAAVSSVSTNIQFTLLENVASDGATPQLGNFVILVGDSTGTLTSDLLTQVTAAVELVRPITVTFVVIPPQINTPTLVLVLSIDLASGLYILANVQNAVQLALYTYFYTQPAGIGWNFNDLLGIAQTVPGVVDVLKFTINGNGFDRTGGTFAVVGSGIINGTVGALVLVRPPMSNITVS